MRSRRVSIPVYGLACGGGGALTVEHALKRIAGTTEVYVNPATQEAYVEFDADRVTVEALCEGIRRCGFHPGTPALEDAGPEVTRVRRH